MEVLVLCMVAAAFTQHVAKDWWAAVSGREFPSQRYRMQRLKYREKLLAAGYPVRQRGPFRQYLADMWALGWQTASRRHTEWLERHEEKRRARRGQPHWARQYVAYWWRTGPVLSWDKAWQRAIERRHNKLVERGELLDGLDDLLPPAAKQALKADEKPAEQPAPQLKQAASPARGARVIPFPRPESRKEEKPQEAKRQRNADGLDDPRLDDVPLTAVHNDHHPYCIGDDACDDCKRNGSWRWECHDCGAWEVGYKSRELALRAARDHHRYHHPNCPGSQAKSETNTETTGPETTPEPGTENPTNERKDDMTANTATAAASGEVTGLQSAINYVALMRQSAETAVSSLEQSMAGLQSGGVSGPTLEHLTAAQEHMSHAAQAFAAAEGVLRSHMSVREAYEATPDAGSKEFVTSE